MHTKLILAVIEILTTKILQSLFKKCENTKNNTIYQLSQQNNKNNSLSTQYFPISRNTLGENIADNGGIKAAYHGYFKEIHLKNQFPIKNLNFTSEQLFFISYAQVWCNGNTEEYEKAKMMSNPHPPSKLRVKATLANSEEFSQAFQCKQGDAMSSQNKCKVW